MTIQRLARADLWDRKGYQSLGVARDPKLRLNCNENPWPPVKSNEPLLNRYPEKQPAGLIARMAELYNIAPSNMLVTRGADDGIDALIRAFCNPGVDSIVQCPPAFVMYEFFARLQAVTVNEVPLLAGQGFAVDFETLAEHVDSKIYFLCNPNNPTGSLIDSQKILQFADAVSNRALVVVDEAYIEFASIESLARSATDRANLVVLRTLSKAWSLAGARLGAVIANADVIQYLRATTSPYPLSRSAVADSVAALDSASLPVARQRIEEIKSERNKLAAALPQFEFVRKVYPGEGNFVLIEVDDVTQLLGFMLQRGVLLRDQSSQFGLSDCVRISVGRPDEMTELLRLMNEYQEAR